MIVRLNRFFQDLNNTLGCLQIPSLDYPLFTCELAWKFNQEDTSSIPEGVYEVVKHHSRSFGNCFEVLNVPNRTEVLIHVGNTFKNTKGCILVGLKAGNLKGEEASLSSRKALDLMNKVLPEKFELHIINKF